jgi:hypothetical protein
VDIPGNVELMRIIAKQAKSKVSSMNLPDGCYTQSGRQTSLQLMHVPLSRLQTNLGIDGWPHAVETGWTYMLEKPGGLKPGQEND